MSCLLFELIRYDHIVAEGCWLKQAAAQSR